MMEDKKYVYIPNWLKTLMIIQQKPDMNTTEITKELKITWNTTHNIIKKLIRRGIIKKTKNKQNKRTNQLIINPEYIKLVEEMNKLFQKDIKLRRKNIQWKNK